MSDGIHDGDAHAFREETLARFANAERAIGDLFYRCAALPDVTAKLRESMRALRHSSALLEKEPI